MRAVKGDWIEIGRTVLTPDQRAPGIPEDTGKSVFQMRVKGFLQTSSALPGDTVTIITLTGRSEAGTLLRIKPACEHGYGDFIPELIMIGAELRGIMREGQDG